MSLSGIFPMRAMSTRFLTARCHRSTLRSFEFRYILPEHVTCSKSRYQVVEFAFIVVLPIAVGLVLLAQRDAVQYPFARILSLHRSFSKLKRIDSISNTINCIIAKLFASLTSCSCFALRSSSSIFFLIFSTSCLASANACRKFSNIPKNSSGCTPAESSPNNLTARSNC